MSRFRIGLNLAYLRPGDVGGSETYVRAIVAALARRTDVDVMLFCSRSTAATFAEQPNISISVISNGEYSPLRRLVSENFRLAWAARADRVSALLSPANFAAPMLATRVPQVVTVHDFQHDELPQYFSRTTRTARTMMFRATFARVDHVIAISEHTRRSAISRYRLRPDRITTIYEGVGNEPDVSREDIEQSRQRYGLRRPFFIYPAMAAAHKNHATLLRAFRGYVASSTECDLVLAGKQTEISGDISRQVRQLGIEDRVHELGYLPRRDLLELVAGAKALLFPSLFEGFGLPVLEAMQLRVPVIASTATSIPEVAGDAALLVDPLDGDAWSRAMLDLAADGDLRAELTRRGLRQIAHFSWDVCGSKTLDIARRVAQER